MTTPIRWALRLGGAAAASLLAAGMFAQPGIAVDDVAAGQRLYGAKCTGCHSVDADRVGPRHRDVVGRKIASVPGFNYSPAIRKLGGVWTPARLDQWLSGTQKMAPGSRMYIEIDDPNQRQLLIAYLKSVSKPH